MDDNLYVLDADNTLIGPMDKVTAASICETIAQHDGAYNVYYAYPRLVASSAARFIGVMEWVAELV